MCTYVGSKEINGHQASSWGEITLETVGVWAADLGTDIRPTDGQTERKNWTKKKDLREWDERYGWKWLKVFSIQHFLSINKRDTMTRKIPSEKINRWSKHFHENRKKINTHIKITDFLHKNRYPLDQTKVKRVCDFYMHYIEKPINCIT